MTSKRGDKIYVTSFTALQFEYNRLRNVMKIDSPEEIITASGNKLKIGKVDG